MESPPAKNPIDALRDRLGTKWSSLQLAADKAAGTRSKILDAIRGINLLDDDLSLVVFGSLGRDEWTAGSDVDWTLLVDGQARPSHLDVARRISLSLEDLGLNKPGRTGLFGNLAFSHPIIHQIGGISDTNENTTRRVLLLLESMPIGKPSAYERVVNGVLDRYLSEDASSLRPGQKGLKVPRFLLNDVVRLWRTMAVDFAGKQRERAGEGWGLRNIKLRLSRKLVFAAGLIVCYNVTLDHPESAAIALNIAELVGQMRRSMQSTPLNILAGAWLRFGEDNLAKAAQMFDAYDGFISTLNDPDERASLDQLRAEDAEKHAGFQRMREVGHTFQESLSALFFDTAEIGPLTRKYGLF
jgi:predicted nucleotidyltransferase